MPLKVCLDLDQANVDIKGLRALENCQISEEREEAFIVNLSAVFLLKKGLDQDGISPWIFSVQELSKSQETRLEKLSPEEKAKHETNAQKIMAREIDTPPTNG